ncbi:MAG TPA: metallophosphoesterase [Gemmatimonadaceae bacterium]|nr:metallophosphoesterase [Gemmatimonadaceae bacterium]
MRGIPGFLIGMLLAGALGCPPPVQLTPPPATASAELVAEAGGAVLIAVGDIASCESRGDELTAVIVDSILRADSAANVKDAIAGLGDLAYPSGSWRDFTECYGESWGDTTKLIRKRMRPVPGNHEHESDFSSPYYRYFGEVAGSPRKGYYSFDLGEWHIIALNSEIARNSRYSTEERKAQEDWLREDLKTKGKKCTLAYWHHPRFASSYHGNDPLVSSFFTILYEADADVVVTGHEHVYERFRPLNPAGVLDTLKGIPSFVVGTGGGTLRGFNTPAPGSAARVEGHFGILKITLGKEGYQWAFIDTQRRVWDPGQGKCH